MAQDSGRRVVTNIALTVDGRYAGPDGPHDMGWVMPYAITEVGRDRLTELWSTATTALMGRVNAEGFMGYWPPVAEDDSADPRDRGFAKWLVDVDKVVFSSTLDAAPWERTTIENRPAAAVVDDLRSTDGGDIMVVSSASVITALLAADAVDRMSVMIFPEVLGGGARLFVDGLPGSKWALADATPGEHGMLALIYDRIR